MTVEVRTFPPIAELHVTNPTMGGISIGSYYDANALKLDIDPWGELVSGRKHSIFRSGKRASPELNSISVFIDGLDEQGLLSDMRSFKRQQGFESTGDDSNDPVDERKFAKGTRFGGKSEKRMCSVVAFMLKSALPDRIAVQIGVKIRWTVEDVVRYAVAIRDALEKNGVAQPNQGFAGVKSGLLKGFGVYQGA